jgi:hypothetical protein
VEEFVDFGHDDRGVWALCACRSLSVGVCVCMYADVGIADILGKARNKEGTYSEEKRAKARSGDGCYLGIVCQLCEDFNVNR